MTNLLRGISHTLAAVTSNCSEFQEAWRSSEDRGFEGHWVGEWHSDVNNERGELRCVLKTTAPDHVRALVHARYGKIMRACYTVDLRCQRQAEQLRLEGETDLGGIAGGVYQYEGALTKSDFNCRYSSKYDHGEFTLRHISESSAH